VTGVLRLVPDLEQPTPHGPCRLLRDPSGDFRLQAMIRGAWKTLYRFDLQEQLQLDYEFANYYLSAHPRSYFKLNLLAARTEPGRRYALHNNQFTIHQPGAPSETRVLTSAAEVRETLERDIRLKLPESPGLELALTWS
jgi:N-hydroxyarylamine O-acetyltransferase